MWRKSAIGKHMVVIARCCVFNSRTDSCHSLLHTFGWLQLNLGHTLSDTCGNAMVWPAAVCTNPEQLVSCRWFHHMCLHWDNASQACWRPLGKHENTSPCYPLAAGSLCSVTQRTCFVFLWRCHLLLPRSMMTVMMGISSHQFASSSPLDLTIHFIWYFLWSSASEHLGSPSKEVAKHVVRLGPFDPRFIQNHIEYIILLDSFLLPRYIVTGSHSTYFVFYACFGRLFSVMWSIGHRVRTWPRILNTTKHRPRPSKAISDVLSQGSCMFGYIGSFQALDSAWP